MTDPNCIGDRILKALTAEIDKRGGSWDAIKAYDADKYRAGIYQAAAQYWKDGSRGGFNTRMRQVTKFGLQDAFMAGADELGLEEADLLNADIKVRDDWIAEEQSHIGDLLTFIDGLANKPDAKLSDADYRLDLWAARFEDVKQRAIIYLDQDGRYMWVYGDTEHCRSCARLNGVVKRASFWQANGVHPRNPPNPKLECGGWKCQCDLIPTKAKVTRGRMPSLP